MGIGKGTVIFRTVLALIFLVIALAPYGAVIWVSQNAVFFSVFVSPLFLLASEIVGTRAITAASRVSDVHKHRVLVWSLAAILSALAAIILMGGFAVVASTPYCTDSLTADSCAFGLGIPAYFCAGAFAVGSVIAVIVTPFLALADAARKRKWLWFVGMLLLLLGALAALGYGIYSSLLPLGTNAFQALTRLDWLLDLQLLAPFVLPVIAFFYSLSGRRSASA